MDIGVLGTGGVGRTLATAFARHDHRVVLGSRRADHPDALDWVREAGGDARAGTFADAAEHGAVLVNCTAGGASLEALGSVPEAALEGKVLLDVANPLDFSGGMPPRLSVCNDDSLAERIARAHPGLRVVKSLNTVTASVMVEPGRVPGLHHVFVCGDDAAAKGVVVGLLEELGWDARRRIDLGGLAHARGTEMYLALWVRLYGALGTPDFNIAVVPAARA